MEPKGGNHGPFKDGRACPRGGAAAVRRRRLRRTARLKYNADYDPIPLAAMEALIADFEAANPDIDVQLNNFDHEGYKTAIRNFLTADAPDLANWYAGNRMAPFVDGRPVPGRVGCLGSQRPGRIAGLGERRR